ncbi:MAG: transglycosylase domain-containing protein [Bacteroidetes bacterium]|nr:transglycosylase domain-containing protein [Bacteroidota bacterium]
MQALEKVKSFFLYLWKKKIYRYSILSVVFLYLVVQYNFLWLVGNMPSVSELKDPDLPVASEIYAADGQLIGKFFRENRSSVDMKSINPVFYKGLVATEDVRFYDHTGIDWKANGAIFWYMIKGDKRGGSTITQQLAKNLFKIRKVNKGLLSYIPGVKTGNAKLKEWMTAKRLEENYSKDEILLLYMNTVDFGSNAFGINTAARTYFNKTPKQLSIDECAILIGLLKATTTYSPVLHPEKSLERRNVVLSLMKKHKVISDNEFKKAVEKPIALNFHIENSEDCKVPYVRSAVAREISEWCSENGYDIYSDGLKIYTTIDMRMQQHAEEAVNEHMKSLQHKFDAQWANQNPWTDSKKQEIPGFLENAIKQTDAYRGLKKMWGENEDTIMHFLRQPHPCVIYTHDGYKKENISSMDSLAHYKKMLRCGFFTIDPNSGFIKTWVGGWNYKITKFDHIVQSKRQPGSTFKPFVYATAFEQGNGPCDTRVDKYIRHEYDEDGEHHVWTPHNANRVFSYDTLTLRQGMATSINSIAVQLTLECGPKNVAETAKNCGISSPLATVPSIGLGSNDVSLLELTSSYAPFINGGYRVKPVLVTHIVNQKGEEIARFTQNKERAISEETAWLMSYMLRGTVEENGGTSQALFQYPIFGRNQMGGKTGTSNNYSDGWYVGVTSELIGGTWVGAEDRCIHFKTSSTGEGMRTALPVFGLFMSKVYADKKCALKPTMFPKEPFPIDKAHNCRVYVPRKDTVVAVVDSLQIDVNTIDSIPVPAD